MFRPKATGNDARKNRIGDLQRISSVPVLQRIRGEVDERADFVGMPRTKDFAPKAKGLAIVRVGYASISHVCRQPAKRAECGAECCSPFRTCAA